MPVEEFSAMPIHPTAILEGDIRLPEDDSVEIGPYVVLRGTIVLGSRTRIEPHATVQGEVTMGEGNTIGHGAVIGGDPQDLSFDRATSSGVVIGSGNTFREYATVHRSTKPGGRTVVGDGNFLMAGAHIGHDCVLGNRNVLANNVLFGGHIQTGDDAFLGGGSVYHQFVRIGDRAMAQGNAGFSQDLPPFVIGHAINVITGLNVVGLRRAGVSAARRAALKRAFELVYLEKAPMERIREAAQDPAWTDEAAIFLAFVAAPSRRGVCR